MMPKHSPRAPNTFLKNIIFDPQTIFGTCPEHVQEVSLVIPCDIISYDMISYLIISYHTIWYDIISYDMTWYHNIIWCHMIWYDVILYQVISYDVIWYEMMSYDIIWYHVMWYDNETCSMDFTLKKVTFKKYKIQKRTARKFCTFSILKHYKMIWFRSSYDNLSFSEKWYSCANWIFLRVTVKKILSQSIHFSNHNQNQFWGRGSNLFICH